ncbi:MAG: cobalt-precorrin-5B (C(1))-methyltransferase [Gammaproteobacteria bacterium]|nr:cobalt-precorrin-5B (C(1))-methyltransferase [Candidatus Thioaporhodococcus sediminis]TNF51117.1 MAG: cobalt-precorrin-5B (C(1))-methyltransferase [Gammaproteobacteria bacterium]
MAVEPGRKGRGLRTGFTTGACAAAAARAATVALVTGRLPETIDCLLPNGQTVCFAVSEGRLVSPGATVAAGLPPGMDAEDGQGRPPNTGAAPEQGQLQGPEAALAVVIKDAGDDPDCTHGAHLTAEVRPLPDAPGEVRLRGGPGVGTVTLPGLGLEVGGPAINPVPRRNILANVRAVAGTLLADRGLEVTVSVPGGEAMARKTLNPRLGILGGISILGTSGIVHPYSTASFRASVVQAIEVAAAQGLDQVVLTTGGRTEKFVMSALPDLPQPCFVQMGDFTGAALDAAARLGIRRVVIGCMVGKLAKMAQGETMTHARRAEVDRELLADLARDCGAPPEVCADIRRAETARYAAERLAELGLAPAFHQALARRLIATLAARYPDRFDLRVLVCDFDGERLLAEVVGEPPALPDGAQRRETRRETRETRKLIDPRGASSRLGDSAAPPSSGKGQHE